VFENRVLRRIFEPMRDKVTWECRELHNEELSDLYCSPNAIRVTKSIRMNWTVHVAFMRERKGVHKISVRKPEGKNHLEGPDVDETILLIYFFRKWGVGA
jgi:hypothetical protein